MVEVPGQIVVCPVMVGVRLVLCVTVSDALPEQPLALITVTEYVPPVVIVMVDVVAVVDHKYEA